MRRHQRRQRDDASATVCGWEASRAWGTASGGSAGYHIQALVLSGFFSVMATPVTAITDR
jgi:hypothetical protein